MMICVQQQQLIRIDGVNITTQYRHKVATLLVSLAAFVLAHLDICQATKME